MESTSNATGLKRSLIESNDVQTKRFRFTRAKTCLDLPGIIENIEEHRGCICAGCSKYMDISVKRKRNKTRQDFSKGYLCKMHTKEKKNPRWEQAISNYMASIGLSEYSPLTTACIENEGNINDTAINDNAIMTTSTGTPVPKVKHAPVLPPNVTLPVPVLQDDTTTSSSVKSYAIKTGDVQLGKTAVKDFPVGKFTAVTNRDLGTYKQERGSLKRLQVSLTKKKYTGSKLSRRIIAAALLAVPALSLSGAAIMFPLIIAAVLANAALPDDFVTHDSLIASSPTENTLKDILIDFAVDCLVDLCEELKSTTHVFFAGDKGNKKGVSHFVKVLSWWDIATNAVRTFILDIDGSEGTSEACADAIQHSLKKINDVIKLLGQCTDSGGGGVLDSLADELRTRHLTQENYLISACTLYALQLALANPVKKTFGEGGLEKRTMMQMLHSCYDLQECFEAKEFEAMWETAKEKVRGMDGATEGDDNEDDNDDDANSKFKRIAKAVLTRWWFVGVASCHLLEHWAIWHTLSQMIINSHDSKSRANTIASGLNSLMQEPVLQVELALLKGFHEAFIFEHFRFLQDTDEVSKHSGFRAQHILVRYYLMRKDLQKIEESMSENEHFKEYIALKSKLQPGELTKFVLKEARFVHESKEALDNHFARWSKDLLPIALAGEVETSQHVAKLFVAPDDQIVNDEHVVAEVSTATSPQSASVFYSGIHERAINVSDWCAFITEKCVVSGAVCRQFASENMLAVHEIAAGNNMWYDAASPTLLDFRNTVKTEWLPLASNTQFVESGVKEAKLCSSTGKQEQMRSVMAIGRSYLFNGPSKLRGKDKVKSILLAAIRIDQRMKNVQKECPVVYKERREELRGLLIDRDRHFRGLRVATKIEDFKTKAIIDKRPNAKQTKRGIDEQPFLSGKVAYSLVARTIHIVLVRQELKHRDVSFDDKKDGIRKLIQLLKEHENNVEDDKHFSPRSSVDFNV